MPMTETVAMARKKHKRRELISSMIAAILIVAFLAIWNWAQWKWMEHEGLTVLQRIVGILFAWVVAIGLVVVPFLSWLRKR